MNGIGMYDRECMVDGISIITDPAGQKYLEQGKQALMFLMHEEQPLLWEFARPHIAAALAESKAEVTFLDVGTGSGVFAILVCKHFGGKVVAIDINPRAVEVAGGNAQRNGFVDIELRHERYGVETVETGQAQVIGIYPPYHLYPRQIESKLPMHCVGGSYGQREFISQLTIADRHLASGGVLFFNMFCLGGEEGPQFLKYVPEIMSDCSLTWTNVLPRISTYEFLDAIYPDRHRQFVEMLASRHAWLYLTDGIVKRDGKDVIGYVDHGIDLKGRTWQDRIDEHRAVAAHEFK